MKKLIELERELHKFSVRHDKQRLDELLHESFIEIGRSGKRYNKADIITLLLAESEPVEMPWSQNYEITSMTDDVALVTYKSAHVNNNGELSQFALRSSLWQCFDGVWNVRFHQGMPTTPFAKNNDNG